jgi:excisionase family DNA binding protein
VPGTRISVLTALDDTGRCAMDDRRLTLSIDQTAEILGISRGLVYGLVARGELPSIRFGRRILVLKKAIDKLVDADDAPAPAP